MCGDERFAIRSIASPPSELEAQFLESTKEHVRRRSHRQRGPVRGGGARPVMMRAVWLDMT